jgi:hypothetical protein
MAWGLIKELTSAWFLDNWTAALLERLELSQQ